MNYFLLLIPFTGLCIVNKPREELEIMNNKCEEERVITRIENVTRQVNVKETLSELCFDLSNGFMCTKDVTHFVPRVIQEEKQYKQTGNLNT